MMAMQIAGEENACIFTGREKNFAKMPWSKVSVEDFLIGTNT